MKIKKYFLCTLLTILATFIFSGCEETSDNEYISYVQKNVSYQIRGENVSTNVLFNKVADDVEWSSEYFGEAMLISAKLINDDKVMTFYYRLQSNRTVTLIMVQLNDTSYSDAGNINAALNAVKSQYEYLEYGN